MPTWNDEFVADNLKSTSQFDSQRVWNWRVGNENGGDRINVFVSKATPAETRVILWPYSVISNLPKPAPVPESKCGIATRRRLRTNLISDKTLPSAGYRLNKCRKYFYRDLDILLLDTCLVSGLARSSQLLWRIRADFWNLKYFNAF